MDGCQKRLDTAYQRVMRMVEEVFGEMGRQMEVIASAYLGEKEKREK